MISNLGRKPHPAFVLVLAVLVFVVGVQLERIGNTNTKTKTDTNTNTETNKGKTNDSYDVIYCLKGDDKRILNMICYRQGL